MKINFNLESVGKDIAILKNNTTKKEVCVTNGLGTFVFISL